LLRQFLAGAHRQLTLIEAPAGYGKTTVMRYWQRHLEESGATVTWISIDPALNDFDEDIEPALGKSSRMHPVPIGEPPERRKYLFLDDFHKAGSFEMQSISRLLQRGEHDFHIVICTRTAPTFPLAKLRLSDQVTDFGLDELKFDVEEAKRLLAGTLPSGSIKDYYDHAEGWPVALQLMRLSSTPGQPLALKSVSKMRAGPDLASYLNEQFLNGLSEEQNQFLLETAHLNPVNGDLADHVRQSTDGWDILQGLNTTHSLVFEQTEVDGSWYRYHQLLQDHLLLRQQTLGEARNRVLHLRAAEWLDSHNRHYAAAKLAMTVGAPDVAQDIVLRAGGIEIGIKYGAQRLASLLDLIPLERINASGRLSLARAYILLKTGRTGEASLIIQDVNDCAQPSDRGLRREIVMLEVHLRLYEDRRITEHQVAALDFIAQQVPVKDQLRRGIFQNFLCLFNIQLGKLETARDAGEVAMNLYGDLGLHHLIFFMHINLSVIDLDFGNHAKAYERRKTARNLQRDYFGHDSNLKAIATIMFSEIAFEGNETEGMQDALTSALNDADNQEGWSEVFLAGYETCLALTLNASGYEAALELVSQAESMIARRSLPRFSRHLKILELDLALSAGHEQDARRMVGSVRTLMQAGNGKGDLRWRGQLLAKLALARFETYFGDPAKAIIMLEQIEVECTEKLLHRYKMRAIVLKFIALVSRGDTVLAAGALERALVTARRHALKGAFVREAERFKEAAKIVIRERGVSVYSPEDLEIMSGLLSKVKQASNNETTVLKHLLTDREYEVLVSLTAGNSNKAIARSLSISEPTVKFHLQNIFGKFGVNSRKLAVELASRNGLVLENTNSVK
jgi:LuxR family maltose regulon positive regulatory protein